MSAHCCGWSVVATEADQRERRMRTVLGRFAHGKTLEAAVRALLDEHRHLAAHVAQLQTTPRHEPAPAEILHLDAKWTTRT